MANAGWEEFEAQHRFDDEYEDAEREETRREAIADAVHSRPDYDYRTDKTTFPCGIDGMTHVRVAWGGDEDITCTACIEGIAARRAKLAASTARNTEWHATLPKVDGPAYRFQIINGELVDTYGEGANGSPADDLALKVTE